MPEKVKEKEVGSNSNWVPGCLGLLVIALSVAVLYLIVKDEVVVQKEKGVLLQAPPVWVEVPSWVEQSPQDGHVVVSRPETENMESWLRQFDVVQVGYRQGTRLANIGHLYPGAVVSFHLVENHRDLPQGIFPDIACFGTVFQYDPAVHGNHVLPSSGNVVVWNAPSRDLAPAIQTWNTWRENANPGWSCDYPNYEAFGFGKG